MLFDSLHYAIEILDTNNYYDRFMCWDYGACRDVSPRHSQSKYRRNNLASFLNGDRMDLMKALL